MNTAPSAAGTTPRRSSRGAPRASASGSSSRLAVLAFLAMLVRAVQHENSCMVHVVTDVHVAEADGQGRRARAGRGLDAEQSRAGLSTRPGARFAPACRSRARPASPSPPPLGGIARGGREAANHREEAEETSREGEMTTMDPDRVLIFDTTLRDGEQSPGISLNTAEKLEIAHQLARLGVDVIEAGFPIASPGDFEAVQAIAREVQGPVIAGLARANPPDVDARLGGRTRRRAPAHPHLRLDLGHPHRAPAADHARGRQGPGPRRRRAGQASYVDDVEFSPMDATRADARVHRRGRARSRIDEGATTINIPDTVGYAMPQEYAAFLTRLYELVPGLRDVVLSVHCHDDLGPGGRQLVRRRAGRRAAGRVRDQRHRRARGQRVARGDRDAAAHARRRRRPATRGVDTTEIART